MQKRVVEQGGAEQAAPSWYLTRDGKQYGPLTDRELSLFAEGGNFKKGDLLWTAGLDTWKPADAIFGFTSSPETDADEAVGANGEDEANGKAIDAPVFVDDSPEGDADLTFELDGTDASFTVEPDGNAPDAEFSLGHDDLSRGVTEPDGKSDASFTAEPNGKATDAAVGLVHDNSARAVTEPARKGDASFTAEPDGKAADAAFSFGHDDLAHAGSEPNGDEVDALVQALHASAEKPKPTLKERVIEEAKKFAGIFLYLWVIFLVLLLTEWIALAEHHVGFTFYGLAAINAVILAKIMLIADNTRFAERLKGMPLVYPIVYKAAAFTTLLFVAYVLEEMLIGGIAGRGFLAIPDIGGGLIGALALWLILCVALIPYFAYREVEQAVGPEMFRRLLLGTLPTRR
jgi:hypothetical protein